MFATVAFRLAAIFLMIAAGWAARKRGLVDDSTVRNLARLLTALFYPALIFSSIVGTFSLRELHRNWQLPVGAFGIMLTGFLVGMLVERFVTDPHSPRGHAFLFQCTINNYSFLPMPFALLFWGERGVALLIFSTLGSEIAVWTLGAYSLTGRKLRFATLRRMLNPPLVTIAMSLVTIYLRDATGLFDGFYGGKGITDELVRTLASVMALFGGATIPLAMVMGGARMAELELGHVFDRLQAAVVVLRLVAIPAVTIGILHLLPLEDTVRNVLILVAAMPSAFAGIILSEIYGADSKLAATSVLITNAVSLITIPLWLTYVR